MPFGEAMVKFGTHCIVAMDTKTIDWLDCFSIKANCEWLLSALASKMTSFMHNPTVIIRLLFGGMTWLVARLE